MCGRFVSPEEAAIERQWHIKRHSPQFPKEAFKERHYDVRPTTQIMLMRRDAQPPEIELTVARWGFIPHWWTRPELPKNTINARSEEAAKKPMWRDAYRKSRCLIPARGWYEWREEEQVDKKSGEVKTVNQRYYMRRKDGKIVAYAGLSSDKDGKLTCAILTRAAGGPVAQFHERMPVILTDEVHPEWLDQTMTDPEKVARIIGEHAEVDFDVLPVGRNGISLEEDLV